MRASVTVTFRSTSRAMGASHSVSWDASVGRDASEGPLLVITAEALKQLTSQIKEQHEAKVRICLSV